MAGDDELHRRGRELEGKAVVFKFVGVRRSRDAIDRRRQLFNFERSVVIERRRLIGAEFAGFRRRRQFLTDAFVFIVGTRVSPGVTAVWIIALARRDRGGEGTRR